MSVGAGAGDVQTQLPTFDPESKSLSVSRISLLT